MFILAAERILEARSLNHGIGKHHAGPSVESPQDRERVPTSRKDLSGAERLQVRVGPHILEQFLLICEVVIRSLLLPVNVWHIVRGNERKDHRLPRGFHLGYQSFKAFLCLDIHQLLPPRRRGQRAVETCY